MRRQRQADTLPETRLRQSLHRRGLRYRLHRRVLPNLNRNVDIVFPGSRVAVDVRGCFWHGCPEHGTSPRSNADWWRAKLETNRRRDSDTADRLNQEGWMLVVVWEHEDPEVAADTIEAAVRARSGARRTPGAG